MNTPTPDKNMHRDSNIITIYLFFDVWLGLGRNY